MFGLHIQVEFPRWFLAQLYFLLYHFLRDLSIHLLPLKIASQSVRQSFQVGPYQCGALNKINRLSGDSSPKNCINWRYHVTIHVDDMEERSSEEWKWEQPGNDNINNTPTCEHYVTYIDSGNSKYDDPQAFLSLCAAALREWEASSYAAATLSPPTPENALYSSVSQSVRN